MLLRTAELFFLNYVLQISYRPRLAIEIVLFTVAYLSEGKRKQAHIRGRHGILMHGLATLAI